MGAVLSGSGCSIVDAIQGDDIGCEPYCEITYLSVGDEQDLVDLLLTDVDDDGGTDLVILGTDSRLYVLEGNMFGFGSEENSAPIGFIGLAIQAGDFIGGHPGFEVAVLAKDKVVVFGWDSSFAMTELDSIALPNNGVAIAGGAFTDRPGDDLVVAMSDPSEEVAIVFWDDADVMQLGPLHNIDLDPGKSLAVTSGYFNMDGDLDVGYATNNGAGVLRGDGAGNLAAEWFGVESPAALAAFSFLGDGVDDLVIAERCAGCYSFTPARVLRNGNTIGSYPYDDDPFNVTDIAAGNFTSDPFPDLFIAGGGEANAPDLIMLFDASGFASEAGEFDSEVWLYPTDESDDGSVYAMSVFDLNDDGFSDVVVIMPSGDEIAIIKSALDPN